MATKQFCDVDGCGQEVIPFKTADFASLPGLDFKVEIALLGEEDADICADCFWKLVQQLDKRPPLLTSVVKMPRRTRKADRNAL